MTRKIRWTQASQNPQNHNCSILLKVPNHRLGEGGPLIEGVIQQTDAGYLYAIQYKMDYSDLVYRHNIPDQPNCDDAQISTLDECKAAVQEIVDNDFLPRLQKSLCAPRMSGTLGFGSAGTLTYVS